MLIRKQPALSLACIMIGLVSILIPLNVTVLSKIGRYKLTGEQYSAQQSRFPIELKDLYVTPEPLLKQVVTLHIEVISSSDEPTTTIWIDLPVGVKLIEGETTWHGSLIANEPQTYEVAICVLTEGKWDVSVTVVSQLSENSSYSDGESVILITTADSAQAIRGRDYSIVQPPGGFPPDTPLPSTPSDICL